MNAPAIKLYQDFLDLMSEALINRDADTFLRHIFLPHAIHTENHVVEFNTRDEAIKHFAGFTDALAAQNVDAYTRVAREARLVDDTHIVGRHDSFMTSHGKLVVPVFSNDIELELRDGIWGANWTRHHVRYIQWPSILPRAQGIPHDD